MTKAPSEHYERLDRDERMDFIVILALAVWGFALGMVLVAWVVGL